MEEFKPTNEIAYKRAKKQAKDIRSFYYNLAAFCLTIPVIILINLKFVPDFYFFLFPIFGWGSGICLHAMESFNYNPFTGKDWEEKMIRKLMEKERQKNTKKL